MTRRVAKVLMFGKEIIGTLEAFSVSRHATDSLGLVCSATYEVFVAIVDSEDTIVKVLNPDLRAFYEDKCSYPAALSRFARVLCDDAARSDRPAPPSAQDMDD